jgi:hypothetical protein
MTQWPVKKYFAPMKADGTWGNSLATEEPPPLDEADEQETELNGRYTPLESPELPTPISHA